MYNYKDAMMNDFTDNMNNTDPSRCACFTGYRPGKLGRGWDISAPGYSRIRAVISEEIKILIEGGVSVFYCGMAMGADMLCAEELLKLRDEGERGVSLRAVIPCADQWRAWPEKERSRAVSLIRRCETSKILQRAYTPGCMQARNLYMLEHSRFLLALFDGKPGGTANTVDGAVKRSMDITIIRPDNLKKIVIKGKDR